MENPSRKWNNCFAKISNLDPTQENTNCCIFIVLNLYNLLINFFAEYWMHINEYFHAWYAQKSYTNVSAKVANWIEYISKLSWKKLFYLVILFWCISRPRKGFKGLRCRARSNTDGNDTPISIMSKLYIQWNSSIILVKYNDWS